MSPHFKIIASLALIVASNGLVLRNTNENGARTVSRRDSVRGILAVGLGIVSNGILSTPEKAKALDDGDLIDVYFGCGCFWHVQHEFVEAEKRILGRDDSSITSRAGYAGGRSDKTQVCYHNALSIGDYGKLGHAEVVAMRIPSSSFSDFAKEYFKLFNDKGDRPDQFGDRGPEYRNLVGIPGGSSSSFAKELVKASQETGDKLDFAVGKGNDGDFRATTFIMDTANYPFRVAEQYHQFHDGFNFGENYPNSYNNLASKLASAGKLEPSTCPNGMMGIGVGGL